MEENSISSEIRFGRPTDQDLEQFISLQSVWIPEIRTRKKTWELLPMDNGMPSVLQLTSCVKSTVVGVLVRMDLYFLSCLINVKVFV